MPYRLIFSSNVLQSWLTICMISHPQNCVLWQRMCPIKQNRCVIYFFMELAACTGLATHNTWGGKILFYFFKIITHPHLSTQHVRGLLQAAGKILFSYKMNILWPTFPRMSWPWNPLDNVCNSTVMAYNLFRVCKSRIIHCLREIWKL